MGFKTLSLTDLEPRHRYDLLVAAVQPRPIGFISTVSLSGVENLAPFSFFMAGGANPASLVYSVASNARGGAKDSLRCAAETGEFVVNLVTRSMASPMNETSAEYPEDVSEWSVSGFTPLESEVVKPKRVAESPIHFECRVFQIVTHGEGPVCANYVIGEALRIHVDESIWTGNQIDLDSYRPIARMGGPNYLDTAALEIFSMPRPSGRSQTSLKG